MELKAKFLHWSARVPVVILTKKTADRLGVDINDKILIRTFSKNPKEMYVITDIVMDLIKEDEIGISSEVQKQMKLKKKQKLDVLIAPASISLKYIKKKLNNQELTEKEIDKILQDIVSNALSEIEISLFVSAMYKQGMSFKETVSLIKAILRTGETLRLNRKYVVDKHCIGGIPGNRTTPLVVSICAAAGLTIPKNSSRAITSPAGTADVIETIARVDFSVEELKKIILKTNGCMVWGGGLGLVPADDKIIHIEKILNLDPQAQLLASIMSKKLSVGSDYILIDIPFGKNAKVHKKEALSLKSKFESLGKHFRKKVKVVLTKGDQPIGNGIGPALELNDIINVLDPKKIGPKDLEKKSIFLAGQLFELSGKAKKGKGEELAKEILYSGKAFDKFKEIIKEQKGHVKILTPGKFSKTIVASKTGKINEINNKTITDLARIAGCPSDKFAGIYLHHKLNENVEKGKPLLTIYAETKHRLHAAINAYILLKPISIK